MDHCKAFTGHGVGGGLGFEPELSPPLSPYYDFSPDETITLPPDGLGNPGGVTFCNISPTKVGPKIHLAHPTLRREAFPADALSRKRVHHG